MGPRVLVAAIAFALAGAGSASATFPGREGRIGFFAAVGCGRYSGEGDPCAELSYSAIVTVTSGGRAARMLARCPGPQCLAGIGPGALWSPDGALLAVEVDGVAPDTSQLAILTADGALVRRLAVVGSPLSWLPGGRRLAILRGSRVLTVAATGGAPQPVTGPRGPRVWSAWGEVAIEHARGIMVWRSTTGRRRLVLPAGERFTYGLPDWSPDGRRLAVMRTDARTRLATIVTVPVGGGRARVVVRGPTPGCRLGDPVWSPAGTRVAFASSCLDETNEETPILYSVRLDGSRLRRLFDPRALPPPELEHYVAPALSWQPRP